MKSLWDIYNTFDRPLWPILADMERVGIQLDFEALEKAKEAATEQLEASKAVLVEAGISNPNSTAQLRRVLYEELGIAPPSFTESDLPSTGADAVALMLARNLTDQQRKVVSALDDYREVSKLLTTYVNKLPLQADENGRVHTEYRQTVETGRLSSGNAKKGKPNLQNIPSRTELGRMVRRAFVAPDGWVLVKADYSQLELRIMAALSRDTKLLNAYASETPTDLHSQTSLEMFGDASPANRRIAKTYNFGAGYGAGGRRLSLLVLKETGEFVPVSKAQKLLNTWWGSFAGLREWREREWRRIVKRGYTQTYFGRRNYIPPLDPEDWGAVEAVKRESLNMPVQGTGADIVKLWMIDADRRLKEVGARTLLQVHDELLVECPEGLASEVGSILQETAYRVLEGVPLVADVKVGPNWQDGVALFQE